MTQPRRLYHVSEEGGITSFAPRPAAAHSQFAGEPLVWAIDALHLHNYLLPRDCPRVTFYALKTSSAADIQRLIGYSQARFVVAIEASWYERARNTTLYLYTLAAESFACIDQGAGYYVSTQTVAPIATERLDDPLSFILAREVELRITPSLWPLRDAVTDSSLQFSCIRMRHAAPR